MIYQLNTETIPELYQIGGKAKSLIEMTRKGLPVPEGFVLSVEFLNTWIDKIVKSKEFINSVIHTTKYNCDRVKKIAAELEFDQDQKESFNEHLTKYPGELFAVRSSSPEEDLNNASFAGMYDTHLGIKKDNIEKYVALVFSSCFDYRLMKYKKKKNFDLTRTSIAVIVQTQVDSEISGVGFSINPLNNCYDEVFINASYGLGESIVSGKVTPDLYIYDSAQKKILEKKVNSKDMAIWLNSDGGILENSVTNSNRQALTDNQIIETSKLIKICEDHYKEPTDIEWTFSKGKLFLLQTRPITSYIPLFRELQTKPGDKKKFYIDGNILTQGFNKPMSVLGLEIWSAYIEKAKLGMLTRDIDGTAPAVHGRHYLSLTSMYKLVGKRGTSRFINTFDGNIRRIFKNIDYKSHIPNEIPTGSRHFRKNFLKVIIKILPVFLKVIFGNYKDIIRKYKEDAELIMKDVKNLNIGEDFKQTVSRILNDHDSLFNSITPLLAGVYLCKAKIKRIFKGSRIESEIEALSMDIDGNPTSDMGHLLLEMASSEDFKRTCSRDEFVNRCRNRDYSNMFMKDYDFYMDKYAVRGMHEIDIATKRVFEDTGMLYDNLSEIDTENSKILGVTAKRVEAYSKLFLASEKRGKSRQFVQAVKKYQNIFSLREHPKYLIVYVIAMLRKLCLNIAEEWVKEGRLEETSQIFDLRIDEISKAQSVKDYDIMAARDKNLKEYKKTADINEWPLVIDSRGKIYIPEVELKDGDIIGDPISPGKITGRAKILKTPYEKPVRPGDILITRTTEPSWTPVFINASGVIMEIGGPLQHGGIIAREYGIPCVSGLSGITKILKDGDLIEVDGYTGVIKILKN